MKGSAVQRAIRSYLSGYYEPAGPDRRHEVIQILGERGLIAWDPEGEKWVPTEEGMDRFAAFDHPNSGVKRRGDDPIYLRRLLREAYWAIDDELTAMGKDEWSQHPAMRRKARLLRRIKKVGI